MKREVLIVCLLTTIVLSSGRCKKNDIIKTNDIIKESSMSNISLSPCGNGEQDYKDYGIKYSLLRTIENVDATIEKNKFDNKTYYFKINFDNKEYWLSPCNLSEEFKINNLNVKLSIKIYNVICPQGIACNDGSYPNPSELIQIQKK